MTFVHAFLSQRVNVARATCELFASEVLLELRCHIEGTCLVFFHIELAIPILPDRLHLGTCVLFPQHVAHHGPRNELCGLSDPTHRRRRSAERLRDLLLRGTKWSCRVLRNKASVSAVVED